MKNARGQEVDDEGFARSSLTYITTKRTCVGVKISANDCVQVRNTEGTDKTTVTFTHAEWKAFIGGVKLGEFDL